MEFAWWGWIFVVVMPFLIHVSMGERREAEAIRRIEEQAVFRKYRVIREKGGGV
jgi:hypothetical protein